LVGIEPASLTAVFCQNQADRTAPTWKARLKPFTSLQLVLSDNAKGISRAVSELSQERRGDPAASILEHGLDLFHGAREAKRVLGTQWRHAEAAWQKAEAADVRVADARRQGVDARHVCRVARCAWDKAAVWLQRVEAFENAWARARAAFELFTPEGRLNDRAQAESEIAAALDVLTGPAWSKVRNYLTDPRSLQFLDHMHGQLRQAEPRPDRRQAMAWRWYLRHRRSSSADPRMALVQAQGRRGPLAPEEAASYERVATVLRHTYRASSAVEGINSVLRMQQLRHRRMTQSMLDLKRLYWNSRRFHTGPRQGTCPYQLLGLKLPSHEFWDLLQADPVHLTQQLSTQGDRE
jgi:hypothetical protein